MLAEIERDYYGHDGKAINKHSDRTYKDEYGNLYMLSRTTDANPRFFEAYGPYTSDFRGALPRLKVNGLDYWGDGISWNKAIEMFKAAIPNMR